MTSGVTTLLTEPQWTARRAAHQDRVDRWTLGRRRRTAQGDRDPVDDFLFDYYSTRPGRLRVWHPGINVSLGGREAESYLDLPSYHLGISGVTIDPQYLVSRATSVGRIHDLLQRTQRRAPQFGCFGMHEWAMVYRLDADAVRHRDRPLRLTPDQIAEVVERQDLRCTHFDAFRFFTPDAVPRNYLQLTRAGQRDDEQPGCLHANMDIYKWAKKLTPLVASDLVADAFELARRIRILDMQASPYDLSDLGYTAVPVESAAGRRQYVGRQRRFAEEASQIRLLLIDCCKQILLAA